MPSYVISYRLRVGKDYPKLYEYFGTHAGCAPLGTSAYLIQSDANADDIAEAIRQHVDADDIFYVIQAVGGSGTYAGYGDDDESLGAISSMLE